jgi:hypothetical protein
MAQVMAGMLLLVEGWSVLHTRVDMAAQLDKTTQWAGLAEARVGQARKVYIDLRKQLGVARSASNAERSQRSGPRCWGGQPAGNCRFDDPAQQHRAAQREEATQQNAALVEQSAAAADSLRDESHRLSEAVHKFRIEGEVPA